MSLSGELAAFPVCFKLVHKTCSCIVAKISMTILLRQLKQLILPKRVFFILDAEWSGMFLSSYKSLVSKHLKILLDFLDQTVRNLHYVTFISSDRHDKIVKPWAESCKHLSYLRRFIFWYVLFYCVRIKIHKQDILLH